MVMKVDTFIWAVLFQPTVASKSSLWTIFYPRRYLAYSIDLVGDERYTVYIRDLENRINLPDFVLSNCYSITWISDEEFIYNKVTYLSIQPLEVSSIYLPAIYFWRFGDIN